MSPRDEIFKIKKVFFKSKNLNSTGRACFLSFLPFGMKEKMCLNTNVATLGERGGGGMGYVRQRPNRFLLGMNVQKKKFL